jgi:hypothetical protein
METKQKIESLLKKLAQKGKFDFEKEKELRQLTEITGLLVGKDKDEVILKVNSMIFHLSINDIEEINETNSKAYTEEVDVEVIVKIKSDSIIRMTVLIPAKEIGNKLGVKPLVYDIPSDARKFDIPANEYLRDLNDWMTKTNLTDIIGHSDTPTLRLTQIPTGNRTGTQNNDTTIDYSTDYLSDVD